MTTNLTNDPAITLAGGAQPLQDQANLAPATAAPSIEIPSIQELSPDQCLTSLRENSSVGRVLLRESEYSRSELPNSTCNHAPASGFGQLRQHETVVITNSPPIAPTGESNPTLADVIAALDSQPEPACKTRRKRRRDIRSSVVRLAELLNEQPDRIPLDFALIGRRLDAVNPIAAGISVKTLSNIRWGFACAVRASGLKAGVLGSSGGAPLASIWAEFVTQLPSPRSRNGLSRLIHYASRKGTEPHQVNDTVLADLTTELREGSLRQNQQRVHRTTAIIWNEIAALLPELCLRTVTVPASRRRPRTIIDVGLLPASFRQDVDDYLAWCKGTDPYAPAARNAALAQPTVDILRRYLQRVVTDLVNSGIEPRSIASLADLVSPEALRAILRARHHAVNGRESSHNTCIANSLVQMARDWVKVDGAILQQLQEIVRRVPRNIPRMTLRNKALLRQFDDPAALQRLRDLPGVLWDEVMSESSPSGWTLAKAHAALAIAIPTYMPVRLSNLTALAFDEHIFLPAGKKAKPILELPPGMVKNKSEVSFEIPDHIAQMLTEYRERLAPKIIRQRPSRLFVNTDGSPKTFYAVRGLIQRYLKKRAGLTFNPHLFRHLAGKIILDQEPGSHELVKQLLGHKSLKTTVDFYAGLDSRRAARHHQQLIEKALSGHTKPAHAKPRGRLLNRMGR